MSNLSEISIDKIETDVMSVLYANIDKKFTQYGLFNKLLVDKYEGQYSNSIYPNFKYKFLLVVRNLMSKYDDIIVEKKDDVYYILCSSSKENIQEIPIYSTSLDNPIKLEKSDVSGLYDFICDNYLNEYMEWVDPFNGNTIFHELISNNNINQTSKLIKKNKFNFEIKNNNNQTPTDFINSLEMSNLIIAELNKKIMMLTKKYNQEKSNVDILIFDFKKKIDYYESDEFKNKIISDSSFYDIMMKKTNKYHFLIKMYLLSFIVCYIAIKMIF